jgi:DNA recombination protein RmuC
MEIVIIIMLSAAVLALILVIFYLRKSGSADDKAGQFLQNDLANLRRDVGALSDNLRKTFDERLDKTQSSVHAQLRESAKIINDVSARLTKLDETNKRVVDVTTELKTLQNVLQNPKQRGVFGEYYLANVLDNVLPPNRWQAQYKFRDGEIVDAVIFLENDQILPIDSKFSLENYNRLVEARDQETRKKLATAVKNDLKTRIDETAKYIRPAENTMDFAFMFVPSEAVYYDLLINRVGVTGGDSRDLIEYAFRDKRVIIVSPTSFMAYLQTVLQGLRSLQIEEQAKDIQARVGQLGAHLSKFDDFMQRLGNSLGTTVNHFNNAHRELKKVDKDVVKIAGNDAGVEPLAIDKPKED